jgi:general secretion pathway protein E/type IV pilus assembly protein PilB
MNRPYLSPVFCSKNGILIISTEESRITFGMIQYEDDALKLRIKKIYSEYQCAFIQITSEDFNLKLSQLYSEDHTDDKTPNSGGNKIDDSRNSIIDHITDDAPVINLLNSIFLEAISKKASDIHIESGKDNSQLRFRTDGIMVPVRTVPLERANAVSARLKLLANLNVMENRRPQDGHIDITTETYTLDVRVSINPTIWGESIVLRLLNRSDAPLSVDSLGFSIKHQVQINNILLISSGLVLVTGPTGSGKTTTLAAILKELNKTDIKIISIEDPVEYRIEGITQMQVNEELGLTFETILRRIFRQDPDIIMVGEIRDSETAELAIRAALTGHLVFATLHTNNASDAIYRLQNMGIPPYLVAAVLRTVIAQRLIRKICIACQAKGCSVCAKTGFYGRTAIAEIITITPELSDQISCGVQPEKLRLLLKKADHKTLFDDAKDKVLEGITTDEEVKRELGAPP